MLEVPGGKKERNKDMERRLSVCQSLHNFTKCTNVAERKGKEQTSQLQAGLGVEHTGDFQPYSQLWGSVCSAQRVLPPSQSPPVHSSSAVDKIPSGHTVAYYLCPPFGQEHLKPTMNKPSLIQSWTEMDSHGQKR